MLNNNVISKSKVGQNLEQVTPQKGAHRPRLHHTPAPAIVRLQHIQSNQGGE
jgi:hypothetical protein